MIHESAVLITRSRLAGTKTRAHFPTLFIASFLPELDIILEDILGRKVRCDHVIIRPEIGARGNEELLSVFILSHLHITPVLSYLLVFLFLTNEIKQVISYILNETLAAIRRELNVCQT